MIYAGGGGGGLECVGWGFEGGVCVCVCVFVFGQGGGCFRGLKFLESALFSG